MQKKPFLIFFKCICCGTLDTSWHILLTITKRCICTYFLLEWTTKTFFWYDTVARLVFQVPSEDGFEEACQLPKKFNCGHTELWDTLLYISVNSEKMLLAIELSVKVGLSISKLWQCVSRQTLWSLKIYQYLVGHFKRAWSSSCLSQ